MQLPWTRRLHLAATRPIARPEPEPPVHLFTVDVEEYFQVSAFESAAPRESWGALPSRIEWQMDLLLGLLAERGCRGTFFVLGWIARRHPAVVRRIMDAGHEIASHGYFHQRVLDGGAREFRAEVSDSKALLEDLCGRAVLGYRAPSFSITPGREWTFDILLEEGYRYDSSLFPIWRPGYGHPGALSAPFWIERLGGRLLEVPMTTLRVAGARLPAAGGAYFRHLPYAMTRAALRRARPGVFYIHPWELDVEQPGLAVSGLTRRRHYGGIHRTVSRLRLLLAEFRFTTIDALFPLRSADDRLPAEREAAAS